MDNRSLEALGLDDVPALRPLTYPGAIIKEPGLLLKRHLLPLEVSTEPVGQWSLTTQFHGRTPLDLELKRREQAPIGERHPVIAIGSNGSPGQISHKMRSVELPDVVPMVPVRVTGIGVGVSAHVSPAGYVAISPFFAPDVKSALVITWLDDSQLAAMDATENPEYRRVRLPGDEFPAVLPSGDRLDSVYMYVNSNGVLADEDGSPLPAMAQPDLLRRLLGLSEDLRKLLGDNPETFVRRARADGNRREQARLIFGREGWVLPQPKFDNYVCDGQG